MSASEKKTNKNPKAKGLFFRSGSWYFQKMISGRRVRESLGTGDLSLARKRADVLLAQLLLSPEKFFAERSGKPGDLKTLGEVCDAYEIHGLPTNADTRRANQNALLRVAAEGTGRAKPLEEGERKRQLSAAAVREREGWRAIGLGELSPSVVHEFFRRRILRAGNDPKARNTAIHSARSMLANARSVFTHREAFGAAEIPESAEKFLRVKAPSAPRDTQFKPLSAEEGEKLMGEAEKLKSEAPQLRVCFLLMLHCGCRNCEVESAQWEWFEPRRVRVRGADGVEREESWTYLNITERPYFKPKQSLRKVRVPEGVWQELQTLCAESRCARAGEQWLLGAGTSAHEREELSHRMFSRWFRGVLPDRQAYDLRKQAGSMVAEADPRHLWAAKEFLGHKQITTTESYYASPIDPVAGVVELRWG